MPAAEAPDVPNSDGAAVTTTAPTPVAGGVGDAVAPPAIPGNTTTSAAPAPAETPATSETLPPATVDPPPSTAVDPEDPALPAAVPGAEAMESVVSEDVPDIEMLDVSTGATVSLRAVVTGATPLLFWFWSPL